MRISTSMMQRLAINSITDKQAELSYTQQQLASGFRILKPSDDPSDSSQILRFIEGRNLYGQYQDNANRLSSRLETEEGVLAGVVNSLQRVRELAVQGLNDVQGPENRIAIASEVRQRLDELYNLANSTDGSGEFLFGGYEGTTQPFVTAGAGVFNYQGDQGQREIQISEIRKIESTDTGYDLFVDLSFSGGGKQDIMTTIYNFAVNLEANIGDPNILTDIDTAMNNVLRIRAEVGARLNAVDAQVEINTQASTQLDKNLSELRDLDYAEAIGRMHLQLAGVEAAQKSYSQIQQLSLFNFI